jgi:glucosamine-6-phosphate deaminase
MQVHILKDPEELGSAAGKKAASLIKIFIKENGVAHIILATGASQFETLKALIDDAEIEWRKVIMFHLDEYIGITDSHKASFRKYLKERFLEKVPELKAAHLISGEGDPGIECKRLSDLIRNYPIDIALVGIGENGHLAFNDPPADFETDEPYIIVTLDENCRKQQLNEGWFDSLDDVPAKAISMSIKQIMLSKHIICSVPDERKAKAIKDCFQNKVSNLFPSSILQQHNACDIYLDMASASLLENR